MTHTAFAHNTITSCLLLTPFHGGLERRNLPIPIFGEFFMNFAFLISVMHTVSNGVFNAEAPFQCRGAEVINDSDR